MDYNRTRWHVMLRQNHVLAFCIILVLTFQGDLC